MKNQALHTTDRTRDQGAAGPKVRLVLIKNSALTENSPATTFVLVPCAEPAANEPARAIPSKRPNAGGRRAVGAVLSSSFDGDGDTGSRCLASQRMAAPSRSTLLLLLARCALVWIKTGSLACAGLYLLVTLALRHPRIRAAFRWLPAAGLVRIALGLMWPEIPWTWTSIVDAIAQVAGGRVCPQLVAVRAVEHKLIACPTCLGTGRDPEAPAAIADDDGTCPGCCNPRHPLYAAHHGYVRPA